MVGPDTYTLKELVQCVGELIERPRLVVGIPTGVAMLQAMVLQMVPGQPLDEFDNVRSLERDNVSESGFPSELLGFAPSKLEAIAPVYLGPLTSSQAQLRRLPHRCTPLIDWAMAARHIRCKCIWWAVQFAINYRFTYS